MQGFHEASAADDDPHLRSLRPPYEGETMSAAQLRMLFPATCASALASRLGRR
jgi:hypothetical protein